MNLWGHRFSQNANQKFEGFLLYPLINFQSRNPSNFWLAFWEKWWPNKFILNLTDLYKVLPNFYRLPHQFSKFETVLEDTGVQYCLLLKLPNVHSYTCLTHMAGSLTKTHMFDENRQNGFDLSIFIHHFSSLIT